MMARVPIRVQIRVKARVRARGGPRVGLPAAVTRARLLPDFLVPSSVVVVVVPFVFGTHMQALTTAVRAPVRDRGADAMLATPQWTSATSVVQFKV